MTTYDDNINEIEKITTIDAIEDKITNINKYAVSIRTRIIDKYISLMIDYLNNIIKNTNNTEKNEKPYALNKLKLIDELKSLKRYYHTGEHGYQDTTYIMKKIKEFDENFKSFDPNSIYKILEDINDLKNKLLELLKKKESNVKSSNAKTLSKITELENIVKKLEEFNKNSTDLLEDFNECQIYFNKFDEIKYKLNSPVDGNIVLSVNEEFNEIRRQIHKLENILSYSLDSRFIEDIKNTTDSLLKIDDDYKNIYIYSYKDEYNKVIADFTNIKDKIETKKFNNKNLLDVQKKASEKLQKTTSYFKKISLIIILISLLLLILLIIAIVIDNNGMKIASGISIPILLGGLGYYYYRNKDNIKLKK